MLLLYEVAFGSIEPAERASSAEGPDSVRRASFASDRIDINGVRAACLH